MFMHERSEDGASAVEYGLLVAGIAALITAVVFVFGGLIQDVFVGTCEEIDNQAAANSVAVAATCS